MLRSLTKWLPVLAMFFLGCPAWATWSMVQHVENTACTVTSSTCAVTISSTGAGHVLFATSHVSAVSYKITAVSGGGTWVLCTNCAASDATAVRSTDIAYSLSSSSGTTSVTVTRTDATSHAWSAGVFEYSTTAGGAALDVGGNLDQSTPGTTSIGVALTLSGANDVILQTIYTAGSAVVNSITTPYTNPNDDGATTLLGWAGSINTASGAAPTWSLGASGRASESALAIKEVVTCAHALSLLGAGCS